MVGIAAAGQMPSDMPSLVGHCVNLLPIRVAVDAQTPFDAAGARSRGSALLDAFEHQTLTYGALLKKLPVPRDPSRLPLVNVLFNVDRDAAPNDGNFPDLRGRAEHHRRAATRTSSCSSTSRRWRAACRWRRSTTPTSTTTRPCAAGSACTRCLLRAVVRDPAQPVGRLALLSHERGARPARPCSRRRRRSKARR